MVNDRGSVVRRSCAVNPRPRHPERRPGHVTSSSSLRLRRAVRGLRAAEGIVGDRDACCREQVGPSSEVAGRHTAGARSACPPSRPPRRRARPSRDRSRSRRRSGTEDGRTRGTRPAAGERQAASGHGLPPVRARPPDRSVRLPLPPEPVLHEARAAAGRGIGTADGDPLRSGAAGEHRALARTALDARRGRRARCETPLRRPACVGVALSAGRHAERSLAAPGWAPTASHVVDHHLPESGARHTVAPSIRRAKS